MPSLPLSFTHLDGERSARRPVRWTHRVLEKVPADERKRTGIIHKVGVHCCCIVCVSSHPTPLFVGCPHPPQLRRTGVYYCCSVCFITTRGKTKRAQASRTSVTLPASSANRRWRRHRWREGKSRAHHCTRQRPKGKTLLTNTLLRTTLPRLRPPRVYEYELWMGAWVHGVLHIIRVFALK